jgi:hypothetical protein
MRGPLSNGADLVPGCSRSASRPHWLRRASPLQGPVDGRAGNGEQLSEFGAGVLFRVPQLDEVRLLSGFELGLLAAQSALGGLRSIPCKTTRRLERA